MLARVKKFGERETPLRISPEELELFSGRKREINLADDPEKGYDLYVIKDFMPLTKRPGDLALGLMRIRREVGSEPLLYCAGAGELNAIAPLAYAGVDLFDSIECVRKSRDHELMESSFASTSSSLLFEELFDQNLERVETELELVRIAIENGSIRELAEARSIYGSSLNVFVRSIDREYSTMESFSPTASKDVLKALSSYSLSRAEFERYRRRVTAVYRKPEHADTMLILPCSARKPYSLSKSHRLFAENTLNRRALHEVIITSPLALVPRELELFFPCSNYDIHVSHQWYEDEKAMIRRTLADFIEKNDYRRAIVHFDEPFFTDVLEERGIEVTRTCVSDPRSEESLRSLREVTGSIGAKSRGIMEDMKSAALFQFGLDIFEGCYATGKYPYVKLMRDKRQLAMLNPERGFFSLTLDGAKALHEMTNVFDVEIDFDPEGKGSIFVPGIKNASQDIREGDEVCITKDGEFIGVGVAEMCGIDMNESKSGIGVKVRHLASLA
jgi:archaeosine synthase